MRLIGDLLKAGIEASLVLFVMPAAAIFASTHAALASALRVAGFG